MATEHLWFTAVMANLAALGGDLKRQVRCSLDSDQVAEFVMWYVIPYASRHSLTISEELSNYLEGADLMLDMEEDHNTARLCACVSATQHCLGYALNFDGFRDFVIKVSMHKVTDDCELDLDHLHSLLKLLEKNKKEY
jgi:hypothetical protein